MADTNHRDLTGAALHEPKGAAAASENDVFFADGAASGAFESSVPRAVHYQYQESNGANGEAYGTSSYGSININTEVSDPNSLGTLASKVVTLGAGTWMFMATAGVYVPGDVQHSARIRIQNTTDASTVCLSRAWRYDGTANHFHVTHLSCMGIQVITGNKDYELQGIASNAIVLLGLDDDGLTSDVEVYADLMCIKMIN